MTMVPRTSEGSASSAPLTTAWYQAGKSSDCLGSATARSLSGRLRAASGESNRAAAAASDTDPPDGAEHDRGKPSGEQHGGGGAQRRATSGRKHAYARDFFRTLWFFAYSRSTSRWTTVQG